MKMIFFLSRGLFLGLIYTLIYMYRYTLRPFLMGGCRFWPSCSYYAQEALKEHGVFKGSMMTFLRLCRCHPWGGEGVDPVPNMGNTWVKGEEDIS